MQIANEADEKKKKTMVVKSPTWWVQSHNRVKKWETSARIIFLRKKGRYEVCLLQRNNKTKDGLIKQEPICNKNSKIKVKNIFLSENTGVWDVNDINKLNIINKDTHI